MKPARFIKGEEGETAEAIWAPVSLGHISPFSTWFSLFVKIHTIASLHGKRNRGHEIVSPWMCVWKHRNEVYQEMAGLVCSANPNGLADNRRILKGSSRRPESVCNQFIVEHSHFWGDGESPKSEQSMWKLRWICIYNFRTQETLLNVSQPNDCQVRVRTFQTCNISSFKRSAMQAMH